MCSISFARGLLFCNIELSVWRVKCLFVDIIKRLPFIFILFNTHIGCKIRKKLLTLRSKTKENYFKPLI